MTALTFALSKGRIFDETMPLLQSAGVVEQDAPKRFLLKYAVAEGLIDANPAALQHLPERRPAGVRMQ